MGLFRRKHETVEVEPTAIDTAATAMATAVKHIRSLDSEVASAFEEWRQVQAKCSSEGISVELHMSTYMRAAFVAWHEAGNGGEAHTVVSMEQHA